MPPSRPCEIAILGLALGLSLGCGRATGVPRDDASSAEGLQRVPFNHPSQFASSTERVRAVSRLPQGTPIAIRLLTPLSSASSHAGDTFHGVLDDAVVVEGEIAISPGAAVSGRVLVAKAAGEGHDPGYLRITLVSLAIDGKQVTVETSSLFAKGLGSKKRDRGASGTEATVDTGTGQEGEFGEGRRLTFRLARAVDLH